MMENGVEDKQQQQQQQPITTVSLSEEEKTTKAKTPLADDVDVDVDVDGGEVSDLSFVDSKPPLSEEDETTTMMPTQAKAEEVVSNLMNLAAVVHHDKKDSEADDIFEEAIMMDDGDYITTSSSLLLDEKEKEKGEVQPCKALDEVAASTIVSNYGDLHPSVGELTNGNLTTEQAHEVFEEAIDTDLPPTEDVVQEAVDEIKPADGLLVVNVKNVLPDGVVGNEKESSAPVVDDVDGETKSFTADEVVESCGNCDASVCEESSGNGDEFNVAVDDDDISKELLPKESPDAVVCNGEEDENKASPVIANGEKKPLTDAEAESNGICDAFVHDESDNGVLKMSEFEEKPVNVAKSSDVGRSLSGEVALPEGIESGEQILSEDGQNKSDSFAAAVNGKAEKGKIENGDSKTSELEGNQAVLAMCSDVDKVGSHEIALSDGNESNDKKILSEQDDQRREMNHTVENVDTFVNEEFQTPEIKNVPNILGASVDKVTDIKEDLPDIMIDQRATTDAAELDGKESQNVQVQQTSENIEEGTVNRAVVKEVQIHNDSKPQDSTIIEASRDSGSAREPEIQLSVEPVQAPPRRPAGLGGAAPLFEPAPRALQQPRVNGAAPQRQAQLVEDPMNGEAEENDETREKLQMIRVKFLRLAHRLGQTPHNVVVAQVLYRLGLAEQLRGRNAGRVGAFSFDRASALAEQLESAGQEPLDFSCTIMVLGKTGVGKSATINSIFDENKFSTDAFQLGTKKVQDVVGTVQGIKVRVIDTPGLLPCSSDQRQNEKILHSVKRFIKKTPPDIVLYLDRLDMQSRDFGDLPLLRTITEIFGPSIWFNAIVVLTHAASAPPDGPNGIASSYEMFVTQRSHVVQQAIRQAAGDMRLMNPVSLVENHSACRTNRAGQRVLPNGQVWKPHLLLLSFASKILAEANTLLKLQDNPPGKPFATRPRVPPLPFLLSSLLQSRPQLKLPEDQFGDEDDLDEDLDDSSDSDDESEYDELPSFKRLTKAQLAKLSKAQKKAYFDELEYRETLFMKKQLREEKKRRKLFKKMADSAKEVPNDYSESAEEESGGGASVPVAMPDFSLPASFDSDNPSHRYRFLDTSNPWLVRPVLETHGWDHDVGYEGINVERLFVVKDKIPVSFSGQATKDKKESNLQMEIASSIKHSERKATSVGFDMQTVGKDMSYTLRSETRFSNFRNNKTAAGLSVTLLGDALTAGMKVEDRLVVNKRFRVVLTGGAMTGRGDVAYGGSLEATLRDKDYPLGRMLSTLGLSVMDWHGDLAIGCNVQSQIPIGRSSNLIARANLNNRGSGQVSIRLNSSEQLQIALVGLLPLFRKVLSLYQQAMHGE